jgi:hypothetical protein
MVWPIEMEIEMEETNKLEQEYIKLVQSKIEAATKLLKEASEIVNEHDVFRDEYSTSGLSDALFDLEKDGWSNSSIGC